MRILHALYAPFMPYTCLMCTLYAPYACLVHTLCTPYACFTCALEIYDWLRLPTTVSQITGI